MQETQIGIFTLNIDGKQFKLIPSLRNMAKLANAKRILTIYDMIHSHIVPDWLRCNIGREILLACSDSEDIDTHLIKCRNQKPHLNNKKISVNDQVLVAAALMRHGIAGVNRPKHAGSKGKGKPLDEFDINKIVADAMIHFGLSKQEALNLTMSEFYYLLASKYPADSKKQDTPSLADHKAAMKVLMEQNNGK
jgi:hypothetical protein